MTNEAKKRLMDVLRANIEVPYADDCIREIENGNLLAKYADVRLATVEHIRHIYSIRAEQVKKYKKPIYGLDRFVENLKKTDRTYVRLHIIEAGQFNYHIFTDDDNEVLFGIVAIDESTDWRKRGGRLRLEDFS